MPVEPGATQERAAWPLACAAAPAALIVAADKTASLVPAGPVVAADRTALVVRLAAAELPWRAPATAGLGRPSRAQVAPFSPARELLPRAPWAAYKWAPPTGLVLPRAH